MSDLFDVSVLIVSYNQEETILDAIKSVVNQDYGEDYELVIADDGSVDHTVEKIRNYNYPSNIQLRFVQDCAHVGPTRNAIRGLYSCRGRYIATLEGDDYWIDRSKLSRHLKMIAQYRNANVVFSDYIAVNQDGAIITKSCIPSRYKRNLTMDDVVLGVTIPVRTAMFRRSSLPEVYPEMFRGGIAADKYLSILTLESGIALYDDKQTAVHRRLSKGIYTNRSPMYKTKIAIHSYIRILDYLSDEAHYNIKIRKKLVDLRILLYESVTGATFKSQCKIFIMLVQKDCKMMPYILRRIIVRLLKRAIELGL